MRLMMESICIPELHPSLGMQRSDFLRQSAGRVLRDLNFSLYVVANAEIEIMTNN